MNLAAGDVLEYKLDHNYGSRLSYKSIIERASALALKNRYRRGDIIPMITFLRFRLTICCRIQNT